MGIRIEIKKWENPKNNFLKTMVCDKHFFALETL